MKKKKLTAARLVAGFKIVLTHLAEHRKDLILLSVLGIISAITNALIPYLSGRLIDAIVGGAILSPLIVWVTVQAAISVVDWYSSSRSRRLGGIVYAEYLTKSFSYLLRLPLSFHKKHKVGEISNKFQQSANAIEDLTENIILKLAPQFLSIITALVLAFLVNRLLAGIILAGLAMYMVIFFVTINPLASLQLKVRKGWSRAFGNSHDAIFNAKAVKEAVTEEAEARKIFRDFRIKAVTPWAQLIQIWQNLNFFQRLTILVTQFIIFLVSSELVHAGTLSVGELVSFNSYAALVFGPFSILANNWIAIQNGLITLEFSEQILQTPTEQYHPIPAAKLKQVSGDILFQGVDFYYESSKPILKNITFEVKAGEVVALVGESGVGKSTLVDLISGYHFARKGKVLVDSHDVRTLDLSFLRSQIAVVPQEVVLFNDSIKTNIAYGNFGKSQEELEQAARQAHALEFIEKFPKKWGQVVGERGVKLSVGQKQRVAIARAILRNPKILILDEPTSALDAKSESIIAESLDELMRGRTTFIIAHRLSTVRQADKIIVIKDGAIAEIGRHEELIIKDGGIYKELYGLQIGLHA